MTTRLGIPDPVPLTGLRDLSPDETMRRASAMACIHKQEWGQCGGQVYINLFFDGTGNNQDWKDPKLQVDPQLKGTTQRAGNKHSNVARLYNAAIDKNKEGFFSYYIPGVGTPFPDIGDGSTYDADQGSTRGDAFGYKGADRINWGLTRVLDAVYFYLTTTHLFDSNEAKSIINQISSGQWDEASRHVAFTFWEKKLKAETYRNRKATQVIVSVFGFSRGAAAARAFTNWFFKLLSQKNGHYVLADIPVRMRFMGLFDTVAAVGMSDAVAGADGHAAWADGTMPIHPAVERCVHFIALHEQRASFSLELADGPNVKQVGYPGMHADVGGGYRPGEQGRAMPAPVSEWGESPQLSQIPLIDMHYAAMQAGVPLLSAEEIQEEPKLAKDFACSPKLIHAVNNFFDHCGVSSGTSEGTLQAHTHQYLRWRSSLSPRWMGGYRFYLQATQADDKKDLMGGVQDFEEHFRELRESLSITPLDLVKKFGLTGWLLLTASLSRTLMTSAKPLEKDTLKILSALKKDEALPVAAKELFEDYVHDSRSGFRPVGGRMEPRSLTGGYFRYRHAFPNTADVEQGLQLKRG